MARIVALGERHRIQVLAIAGVEGRPAASEADVVGAWNELPDDVAVLILTPDAAEALRGRIAERRDLLVTEMP